MTFSKVAFVAVVLVLAATFAFAAKPEAAGEAKNTTDAKNMTFGQCVSDAAEAKNTCYESVKEQRDACISDARNQSDKAGVKSCESAYKQNKDACKKEFKDAKKECGKIKHSAWEGFKASFK